MTHSNFKSDEVVERPQEAGRTQTNAFRYGAMLPIAAVMTIGLTLTMAALVATEFTPQDKMETAEFEINPKVEEIKVVINETTIDKVKKVIPPPPPPQIERPTADKPTVKIVSEWWKGPPFFPKPVITKTSFDIVVDSPEKPLVRIPPVFPPRFLQGDVSGYCRVRFDVSPEGRPYNVSATLCTNNQLMAPTVKSVQRWKYTPKVLNGRPVSRSGLETIIRFDLQDERGATLPVPAGY